MSNSTISYDLPPLPTYELRPLPPLVPPIPDKLLLLILPIAAYWTFSMLFHWIDMNDYFPQYRLHTPAEVLKRNHVSRWEVVRDVNIQQIIQTIVGLLIAMTEPDEFIGKDDYNVAVWAQRIRLCERAIPSALALVGLDASALSARLDPSYPVIAGALAGGSYARLSQMVEIAGETVIVPSFAPWELFAAKLIYWVVVPAAQFALAIVVVDTWQYFLHRAMHMNKWLYTTFHSRHHRLYVPYAYGALYNHPFEGFLLDTLGAGFAYLLAGMTTRQGMWFFTCSTIKTVDDHCGYALPWDPLQHLTSNNAGYHDVHHQSWGIKTNFSQPFFTFWDQLLGTKWVGGDVSARYEKARIAAQKKLDSEQNGNSITHSNAKESISASDHPYENDTGDTKVLNPEMQQRAKPTIPAGKATKQAAASREQVLQDAEGGGPTVLAEEAEEERNAEISLWRSARPKMSSTPSASSLRSLRDRVNGSLHSRGGAVLGVESNR